MEQISSRSFLLLLLLLSTWDGWIAGNQVRENCCSLFDSLTATVVVNRIMTVLFQTIFSTSYNSAFHSLLPPPHTHRHFHSFLCSQKEHFFHDSILLCGLIAARIFSNCYVTRSGFFEKIHDGKIVGREGFAGCFQIIFTINLLT